jgi:hypothetical protein
MKDSHFKRINHVTPCGHRIATTGQSVQQGYGYKPDITIVDAENKVSFILESETKTDRKAFLGDIVKASVYAKEAKCMPELIIVMHVFSNTTVKQISEHLAPYVAWLSDNLDGLCLSCIRIIPDDEYLASIEAGEKLDSPGFRARTVVIWQ